MTPCISHPPINNVEIEVSIHLTTNLGIAGSQYFSSKFGLFPQIVILRKYSSFWHPELSFLRCGVYHFLAFVLQVIRCICGLMHLHTPCTQRQGQRYKVGWEWLFFQLLSEFESESCSVMSDSWRPRGLYSLWNSPGRPEYWSG